MIGATDSLFSRRAAVVKLTSVLPAARRLYASAVTALRQDAMTKARAVLEKARGALGPHVDSLVTRVHEGLPGPAIVDAARACRADLVVVGCRKRRGWRRLVAGRVAIHVARRAHCCVLVAKGLSGGPQRFLLALDGSADSQAAVRWLADLRLSSEAWIHVVAIDEDVEIVAEAGRRLVASGARVAVTVRPRDAGREILAVARVLEPHLIVMGVKPKDSTPGTNVSMGRVAREVVVRARCSVLLARS